MFPERVLGQACEDWVCSVRGLPLPRPSSDHRPGLTAVVGRGWVSFTGTLLSQAIGVRSCHLCTALGSNITL